MVICIARPDPPSLRERRSSVGSQRAEAQLPGVVKFTDPQPAPRRARGAGNAASMLVLHQADEHRAQQREDIGLQQSHNQLEHHHTQHHHSSGYTDRPDRKPWQ